MRVVYNGVCVCVPYDKKMYFQIYFKILKKCPTNIFAKYIYVNIFSTNKFFGHF